MQVTCSECHKTLNIADEKIPAGGRFSVKCPQCGQKIVVDAAAAGASVPPPTHAAPPPYPEPAQPILDLPTVEPDMFPPGSKVAFLYVADGAFHSAAEAWFGANGYHVSTSSDELEAIAKLRLNSYDIVLVEEGDAAKRLLSEISRWPGHKRRAINYVLLGTRAKSLDPNLAFQNGANFYMNTGDRDKAGDLLDGAIRGYELYYQFYKKAALSAGS
ncbi:putative Zn finger-like uncharacterized protein [Desulfobaculum xiamenense]|uniref:Putative Zn finger-like uncharacterized protein n=1 Tax=Desulfobaculum xiamenense TaxID=995050 RepID=A0A846QF73_9BACT|nr:zinc-ribbon domain-containing protein [Desulfobaculum xiamenense]NJB66901.1 putative Zn finger-like uncharacterized protein [Desulfobaculum xiamenense]